MPQQQRPNILLILTDQQRFDTIAALGNCIIKTPTLDRLVREGTAFYARPTRHRRSACRRVTLW